jgi:hypothetical protein
MFTSLISTTFAQNNNNQTGFKDVPSWHWAYNEIMWMLQQNIINGTGNGYFSPNNTVSRAEFAKMMVNTLKLSTYSPDKPSFLDVKKSDWEYSFVESAKPYLTGFRTTSGDYFRPDQAAVREDMAVALVKALGYQNESVDLNILNNFDDAASINTNLRKYVALSVKYKLIEGYTENGKKLFGPQNNLTRAQAATLLYRAFKNNEEKITYDDEKVTYDDNVYPKPSVSVKEEKSGLTVNWSKINSSKLQAYAIVISKDDSTPVYPDNGCMYYITDKSQTSVKISNNTPYNGNSDFGRYLEKGKKYYISVTAVYSDKTVPGNVVYVKYDGPDSPEAYVAPVMTAAEENGRLVLRWNKIQSTNLQCYMVVASKYDSTPSYPENGYLYKITDRNKNYAIIDSKTEYKDGDFGKYLSKGEKYYFSITAVYNDRNVPGNTIQFQYNGADNPDVYKAPSVTTAYENGRLVVKWNKIDSPELIEYRVVISQNKKGPAYPADGYYNGAYSKDTTSAVIDPSITYTGGDLTTLNDGTMYNVSVTAVYKNDKYVAGNAVEVLYLLPPN